jgi:ankyrin repeat protein
MELLLKYKVNLHACCNQRYTPFLLAVRLGNVDMISKMLQLLIQDKGLMESSDLNLRTGIGLNTAFHIAAAKTNFQVLYELDKWGADIFVRNKENKTCF